MQAVAAIRDERRRGRLDLTDEPSSGRGEASQPTGKRIKEKKSQKAGDKASRVESRRLDDWE